MTAQTKAKVECVLLALEWNQRRGLAPKDGSAELTPEYLADLSTAIGIYVSATTWREIEADAVAKLKHCEDACAALIHLRKIANV